MTSIYICMLSNRFALFRCIPNILICFLCRAVLNVHTTFDCNSKHVIARCFVHCIVLLAMSVQTSHIGNAVCHCHVACGFARLSAFVLVWHSLIPIYRCQPAHLTLLNRAIS